ncbi:MAG: hypothetical protein WCI11_21135 [Candidatus Methylumidiphilus sp.]
MKIILACTAIALSVSGCTSTLKDINGGLSTINNGLSTVNSGRYSKSIPQQSNNALITSSQQVSLQSNLKQKTLDKNIDSAIIESSPVIADFITINSCITGYDGSQLNRYAAPVKLYPNNNYNGAPIPQMRYHNKTSCATVLRVQGWKMPARNALQFEVSYISDTSGEVVKGSYEVVKQPNGEWLFTR